MSTGTATKEGEIKCPACDSDAVYKYGRAWTGKQRFQCIVCERQFTIGAKKPAEAQGKPSCPVCKRPMHLYKIENETVRFRCSGYPECRSFRKFKIKEEINETRVELLHP